MQLRCTDGPDYVGVLWDVDKQDNYVYRLRSDGKRCGDHFNFPITHEKWQRTGPNYTYTSRRDMIWYFTIADDDADDNADVDIDAVVTAFAQLMQ